MNPTNDIFSEALSLLTSGIIPDLKTGIMAILTIYMIYIGLDLLFTKLYGLGISERLEYNDYRHNRRKREQFDRMYQNDENRHLPMGPNPDTSRRSHTSHDGF